MTRFVIADPVADVAIGVPFEAFLDIVKSSAIRSAATGDNFFEIGTSENVNIRFQATPDGDIEITMFSTLSEGDRPPLRLQLSGDDEELPASEVERRIRALRQSYAIAYMVDAQRTVELARLLAEHPDADIEEACLPAKEHLYIGTLTPGSLWLTLLTKSKKAYSVLRYGLALPFAEGRFALLERVKADTRLTQLAVEEREVDLVRKRHAGSIDTIRDIEKIKDPVIRQRIMDAFVGQLSVAGGKTENPSTKALRKIDRAEVPPSTLLKTPASSPAVTVKKATRKNIAATLQIENKPNGGGSKG